MVQISKGMQEIGEHPLSNSLTWLLTFVTFYRPLSLPLSQAMAFKETPLATTCSLNYLQRLQNLEGVLHCPPHLHPEYQLKQTPENKEI